MKIFYRSFAKARVVVPAVMLIALAMSLAGSFTSIAQDAGVRTPPPQESVPPPAPESTPATNGAAKPTTPNGKELVYLNVQDQDIRDIIKQISKATGRNFIIDDKVRGKITIISEKMMTQEEAYQAFLSALEVAGFTVVTGPGGIIKIVGLKDAASSPIPIHVDTTPYTDSFVTRLIPLQNISASDISQVIKGLVSPSGNLFAYPSTNTLIMTDSGTNIDRLMKLIKELDQEGPQQILEVIPIQYADAKIVAETVLNLFELKQQQAGAARTTARRGATPQLEELQEVSKIIADERTNSIIVLASKRAIGGVREIIRKLDSPITGREGKIHVHYLKYANAAELAQTLSALTSGSKAAAGKAGGQAEAAAAMLEGGISLVADETTNALIITASAKDYQTLVKELIEKLDIPRRQVYLEAIVMELKLTKGADYNASAYLGKYAGAFLPFGQTFGAVSNLFQSDGFFGAPGLLGGVLSRDQVNIDVPVAGGGTNTITIPAFSAFLNLVQTYSDANVVSSPNILTLDNQEAEINIINKIYAPKTTTTATGIVSVEPVPLEAGLTLAIKPQITEGNAVRLEITHELSNFEGRPTKDSPTPPTTSRKIKTTVMALDGQTIVLGGLMQDLIASTKSKIPILGDIPLIGLLFRHTSSSKSKTNLLVFITPHVIKEPTDFADLTKKKIEQRNRFIEDNYGKRQQRAIRNVLAKHREDLLEYTPPNPEVPAASSSAPAPMTPALEPKMTPVNPKRTMTVVPVPDEKATQTPATPKGQDFDLSY